MTLRVNLTDGGENGLKCDTINASDIYRIPARKVCDWDGIPSSKTQPNKPIIKSRTRSFTDLEKLALEGLNYYWGRNKNHAEGKKNYINGYDFEVYIIAINTMKNAMDSVKLIYNTNKSWLRSGNPGIIEGPLSAGGNVFSRQAICYNVGYIEYSNDWGYQYHADEDIDYKETSAHEIGHTILKAYGGTMYSYGHKGSVNSVAQMKYPWAEEYPLTGEIDIMPYHSDNKYGNKFKQSNFYQRRVAAENDVLGLVWLTKIKIR